MAEPREEIGLAHGASGFPAPDHDGGVACIGGEFPSWLSVEEVSDEYYALQERLEAIQEPPIASVMPMADETADIRDYRAFVVEFQPEATSEHMVTALQLTVDAIRRLRTERG